MSIIMSRFTSTGAIPMLLVIALLMLFQAAVPASGATGQASYYTAPYVPSACYGFDDPPSNGLFAAGGDGNPNIWQGGAACGKFYNIQCTGNGCTNSNTIRVEIIDHCPNGCSNRAFDLSEQAFSSIANTDVGVITVSYSQSVTGAGLEEEQTGTFEATVGRSEA